MTLALFINVLFIIIIIIIVSCLLGRLRETLTVIVVMISEQMSTVCAVEFLGKFRPSPYEKPRAWRRRNSEHQ